MAFTSTNFCDRCLRSCRQPAPFPPPQHKATYLTLQCKTCRGTKRVACKPGLGGSFIPTYCDMADRNAPGASADGCGQQPFVVLPEGSSFVDQQTLKLQVGM